MVNTANTLDNAFHTF